MDNLVPVHVPREHLQLIYSTLAEAMGANLSTLHNSDSACIAAVAPRGGGSDDAPRAAY